MSGWPKSALRLQQDSSSPSSSSGGGTVLNDPKSGQIESMRFKKLASNMKRELARFGISMSKVTTELPNIPEQLNSEYFFTDIGFGDFGPKDDARAKKSVQKARKLLDKERKKALTSLNWAVRLYGSLKSLPFEKRAELLYRENRFFECLRDVEVALCSPTQNTASLVALKINCLLSLGWSDTALSFMKIARKHFANVSTQSIYQKGKFLVGVGE
jgi:hypothetical protein